MNKTTHPLTQVADMLDNLRPADAGMYCLHVQHHEIHICRSGLVPKELVIIAYIKSGDINYGLTTSLWNRIEAKIRTMIREGVIE